MMSTKAEAKGFATGINNSSNYMGEGQFFETTTSKLYIFWIPVQITVEYSIVSC